MYRNGHINTIAAASALRKVYVQHSSKLFRANSRCIDLKLNNNVHLQGFLNTHQNTDYRPLVLILHGWLGCADSLYLLPLASSLYQQGFNIFRLNFRDHGNTQHLNRELFHSCRLQEVCEATHKIQKIIKQSAFYLIGFSLGGNFALRIGSEAKKYQIDIKKIYSICPVMDPENALKETEASKMIYTQYYLRRWKTMLYKKHQYYPNEYNLDEINQQKSLTTMTEHLLLKYTDFPCLKDYLHGYAITGDRLKPLRVNTDVFIAEDDPVIPVDDHQKLYASQYLNIYKTPHGGHCGYLYGVMKMNWIDQLIANDLVQQTRR